MTAGGPIERPRARPPRPPGRPPARRLPSGACDAHVHLFSAPGQYARDPARTEDPAPGDLAAWTGRLAARMHRAGLDRVVVVQSVIYRENPAMTLAALAALGPVARGVTLLRPDATDSDLDRLHDAGMRGVRLDLVYPGALRPEHLGTLAPRLVERGWHLQVFAHWREHGRTVADIARTLPCPLVLDHLAYLEPSDTDAMRALLRTGRVWLKLSSIYRRAAAPFDALDPMIAALAVEAPDRLLWGSNWPHVRWDGAMPDDADLLGALARAAPDAHDRILADNPAVLYGFPPRRSDPCPSQSSPAAPC